MKYLKKVIFCTVVSASLVTGCNTDELKNLNVDPQALSEINLNFMFTSAQLGAASAGSGGDNRFIDWRTNIGFCAHVIQQLANAGGGIAAGDKYFDDFEETSAPFDYIYYDQLKNIGQILQQTGPGGFAEGKYQNMVQAARILKVFLFHRLTDYYGSIPYFETLKASEGIFFPKYDKQKDIYTDLLKELDEATAAIGSGDDNFASADLYYNGDVAKWKKWGFSLMLRLAMRVSNVAPDMANTYVQKAVAGGVFTSNDDNVIVPMAEGPSQWTDQNGISRAFLPGDGGQPTFMSKTFIDWLKGPDAASTADDDPRLMILCGGIGKWVAAGDWQPITTDPLDQKGMPNGQDQARLEALEGVSPLDQNETYSKMNPLFFDLDEDYMLMNYGEVELLLAEASERSIGGLSPAGAKAHYDAGVKATMQMYTIYDPSFTVSDGAVATYLTTFPYGGPNALRMIGEQMWANHFLNWWEAWSDWRRTGFPNLTPINYPGNVTGGQIPQKLAEVASNPNFGSGASANDYTTKVWWAGGPE
jgi:hypothetical protein